MIEIIGNVREATKEEIQELQKEEREKTYTPEWKEKMLRHFLRGHYDQD